MLFKKTKKRDSSKILYKNKKNVSIKEFDEMRNFLLKIIQKKDKEIQTLKEKNKIIVKTLIKNNKENKIKKKKD